MRFTIFSIFIIITVSLLFCSIFLFTSSAPETQTALADTDSQEKFLSDNESVAVSLGLRPVGGFPESENKKIAAPRLKTDAAPIDLKDTTCLVMDKASGAILLKQNEAKVTPIASISKLASALVFLDQNLDWEKEYTVKAGDLVGGGRENVAAGTKIKIKDLFFLSLVSSDNSATEALVHAAGLNDEEFIKKTSEKFKELAMGKTSFSDPTGLSDNNVSTAIDVAKLAQVAFTKKEIREATLTKNYEFTDANGRKRNVGNTDLLLDIFPQNGIRIVGGKTGYTQSAGYCFVGQFIDGAGHEIISIVLGGPDINSRFEETKRLVHWTYANYLW